MTRSILTEPKLKQLNSPDAILNAVSAILERAAIEIIRFIKELGRGKCPWVHYQLPDGRRIATFLSPKAFQGYKWFNSFSKVVNLENGEVYQVSDRHCTCPSWEYQVKTGKKSQCKHQVMRSEHVGANLSDSLPTPQKKEANVPFIPRSTNETSTPASTSAKNSYKLNPAHLGDGLSLERSDDFTCSEYYLKAWRKTSYKAAPTKRRIGRIIETDDGFMAAGLKGNSRAVFALQRDAINWILNYNGISIQDLKIAYIESQTPPNPPCHKCGTQLEQIGWITEPDLCPKCGWVEKILTDREKRRLEREEKAFERKTRTTKQKPPIDIVEAFGGFF